MRARRLGRRGSAAAVLITIAALVAAPAGQEAPSASYALDRLLAPPAGTEAMSAAMALTAEWFGPSSVRVPDPLVPPAFAFPGDRSGERRAMHTLAHAYWTDAAGAPLDRAPHLAGLAEYSAVRLAHHVLRAGHAPTFEYFGGLVRYVSPHVRLTNPMSTPSPPATAMPPGPSPRSPWLVHASRGALAYWTLERYLGWPELQAVLGEFARECRLGRSGLEDLRTAALRVTGRDLSWFLQDAFQGDRTFDYKMDGVVSRLDGSSFRTIVSVRRVGSAVFPGTSTPASGVFPPARAMRLLTRFADGTTVEETWDGRLERTEFAYESRSPVVAAAVDPDGMLLLDADRMNNAISLDRAPAGIVARWSLHWMAWLQDVAIIAAALI